MKLPPSPMAHWSDLSLRPTSHSRAMAAVTCRARVERFLRRALLLVTARQLHATPTSANSQSLAARLWRHTRTQVLSRRLGKQNKPPWLLCRSGNLGRELPTPPFLSATLTSEEATTPRP